MPMTMIEAVAKVCGLPRCVPPDPERDGYHWVRRFRGGPAIPLHWNPTWWHNADRGWGVWGQPDRESDWEYLGPCPSPDDRHQVGRARAMLGTDITLEQLCRALAAHCLLTSHPDALKDFLAPETAERTAQFILRFALGEKAARPKPMDNHDAQEQ